MSALRSATITIISALFSTILSAQAVQREKIYLHLDKSYYLNGETCWFKAYVVQSSDLLPTQQSGILYIDWMDPTGKILKHQILKISAGEANGDFSFEKDLPAGQYYLRAYTNLLRNFDQDFFYSRSLMVYSPESLRTDSLQVDASKAIDLQFFPEGGTLVEGLQGQIAYKAIDASGRSIDVNGKILDEDGSEVALLSSTHKGMGVFPYIPTSDKSYRVVLTNGQSFDIPKANRSGVIMSVNNMSAERILIQVRASRRTSLANFKLVGHLGQQLVFSKAIEANGDHANLEISKNGIRGGVLQLSLLDPENNPRAERIVFIDNKNLMNIRIDRDSLIRNKDSVSFVIHAHTEQGVPVQTYLSLAVANAAYVSADSLAGNISTNLLFQSDIKGRIEDPVWYFQKNNSKNIYALDLVMLTHGWRRFDSSLALKYKPEQTLKLKGKVVEKGSGKPVPNANLTLMMAGIDYSSVYVTSSDADGMFAIDSVDYSDSTKLVWQVRNGRGKMVNADILLDDSNDIPAIIMPQADAMSKGKAVKLESNIARVIRDFSAMGKVETLEAVEVVGRTRETAIGVDRRLIRPGPEDYKMYGSNFISRYAPVLPFMIETRDAQGNTAWRLPSGKPVRFVIDGFPRDEEFGAAGNPYLLLNQYRTDQIDYVIISGTARKGYVIVIQTKAPQPMPKPGIINNKATGYHWARIFYEPKYTDTKLPDSKTTIFWEPYVVTDADGRAVVQFTTHADTKRLIVSAEGIAKGSPGALMNEVRLP